MRQSFFSWIYAGSLTSLSKEFANQIMKTKLNALTISIFSKNTFSLLYYQLLKLTQVGYHLGATSCLISVLKSNEKLLMLIHNSDSDLEHYSRYLRSKTKESGSPLLRSSFKHSGYENTIIFYCLDRFEV